MERNIQPEVVRGIAHDLAGDADHAPRIASAPFNNKAADAILRTSDNVDFHVYRADLDLTSPVFKTMFTLNRPHELADESSCKLANTDPIPVTEESIVLDHLLRLCYPVRRPVISDLALLGRVLEAAIKYDMDAATNFLRERLLKFVEKAPLQVYAIACGSHLEDEGRAAAIAYRTQQGTWLEQEMKREGVAMSFDDTLAGHVYDPCLRHLSAGPYYRLLKFLRTGEATSLCEPGAEDLDEDNAFGDDEDLHSHPFTFEGSDLTLRSRDGVEFHVHRLILQLSSAGKLFSKQDFDTPCDPQVVGPPVVEVDLDGWTLYILLRACYPPISHKGSYDAQHPLHISILRAAERYKIEGLLTAAKSIWSHYIEASPLSAYLVAIEFGWREEAEEAARQLGEQEVCDLYVAEMETATAEVYQELLHYHFRCYAAVRNSLCAFYRFTRDQWTSLQSSQSITHCVPSLTGALLWPTVEYKIALSNKDRCSLDTMKNTKGYNDTVQWRVLDVLDKVPFTQQVGLDSADQTYATYCPPSGSTNPPSSATPRQTYGHGISISDKGASGPTPRDSNRTLGKKIAQAAPKSQTFANPPPLSVAPLEAIAPLQLSPNRWIPACLARKPTIAPAEDSPTILERKVRGLLNKLTVENFDLFSDQIIDWANKSEKEKDSRSLIQVIRLVFESATDQTTQSEMYARLCCKLMGQISPKVRDDNIRNSEGKHITGGHLFRKYLLNRCQEDFARGWPTKELTATVATSKANKNPAARASAEIQKSYWRGWAKRRGLALIKFIGELFKLQMLTERIMHECIKKLLVNVANPEEEELESLCMLFSTIGATLNTQKAHVLMGFYFWRMRKLTKSPNVNSRMQFMLQDVIELRERNWIPRNPSATPTTFAALHEQLAKKKVSAEKDQYQRTLTMSRGGSRRGGKSGDHQQVGPDRWAVASGSQPRPPPKVGDLSAFGKVRTPSMTFAPSNIFTSKKESKKETPIARTGNMFSMLSQNPELANEVLPTKSSSPLSMKPNANLASGGAPDTQARPVRRRLVLAPRAVPKADDKSEEMPNASIRASEDKGAGGGAESQGMTEAEANAQIKRDVEELLSARNVEESETYFVKLPTEHRHRLINKLVMVSLEAKESEVDLVASVFAHAASNNLCSPATFEDGFLQPAKFLDDVTIDAPKAFNYFAKLMKGAGLDKDEERRTRLTSKSQDSSKLICLLVL